MSTVAITDFTFPNLDTEESILSPLGCTLVSAQCRTPEEISELASSADYVITQFAPMNADAIRTLEKAKVIVRYGIGVDNVDLDAARECGIPVCNVPEFCIEEVADHTLAMMLAFSRQLFVNALGVRNGSWKLNASIESMHALRDQTVGVVGFGRIGQAVVRRLSAFGCDVRVFDPFLPADVSVPGTRDTELRELLQNSDVVTLHCPSTGDTQQMMNRETFAQMRPGATLINVGRGTLVDSDALIEALQSGQVGAAGLDVFDPEPLPSDCPLMEMEQVILTAHIASASPRAARTLRESAAEIVAHAVRGDRLPNVVNGVDA